MSVIYVGDLSTALWMRLKAYYEERLRILRLQNDQPMDEAKRNIHIGRIAECKHLLELEHEKNPQS